METREGNKLIAEFMDFKHRTMSTILSGEVEIKDELQYHSSWDWLMPVVEKISNTLIPKEWFKSDWDLSVHYSIHSIGTSFEIGDHDLHITDSGIEAKEWLNISKEPITRTWLAAIEFIIFFNEKKKNKNQPTLNPLNT